LEDNISTFTYGVIMLIVFKCLFVLCCSLFVTGTNCTLYVQSRINAKHNKAWQLLAMWWSQTISASVGSCAKSVKIASYYSYCNST